jgi:hypothetical protein
VFDPDMADLIGIQSDFIDDGPDQIPGFDSVDSSDFDAKRFSGTMVAIGNHGGSISP